MNGALFFGSICGGDSWCNAAQTMFNAHFNPAPPRDVSSMQIFFKDLFMKDWKELLEDSGLQLAGDELAAGLHQVILEMYQAPSAKNKVEKRSCVCCVLT